MDVEEEQPPLIDALAYIDPYSAEMEAQVFRLIEEEMQTFNPPNYLAHHAPVQFQFSSPLMKREWERILAEERIGKLPVGIPPLDVQRYAAPRPAQTGDSAAWKGALKNAQAQLEHQQNRVDNLELLLHYSGNAWRLYNEGLEEERKRLQKDLDDIRAEANALNLERKKAQTSAAPSLQRLEQEWVEFVRKNIEIEKACAKLEEEVQSLK